CVRILNHRLQADRMEQLCAEIARLIDEAGCKKMVLSLGPRDVECLYSLFLGSLVNMKRRLESAGGAMILAELSANTFGVFQATGLDKHFKFFPDTLSALQAIAGSASGPE